MLGADLSADLGLHQLGGDDRHRLLEEIAVLIKQRPTDELLGGASSTRSTVGVVAADVPSAAAFCLVAVARLRTPRS